MRLSCLIICCLLSVSAVAEQYQSFSSAGFNRSLSDQLIHGWSRDLERYEPQRLRSNTDFYSIGSTYFFSDKSALGPLKEFDYINSISNIHAGYIRAEGEFSDSNYGNIGGEYFANSFLIGGSIGEFNGQQLYTATAGYFFTPNFMAKVSGQSLDGDTRTVLTGKYRHPFNETDYIGFTFEALGIDTESVFSTKYFKDLGDETYFTLNGSLFSNSGLWNLGGEYYFSRFTSIGLSASENNRYGISFSHFFTPNILAEVGYQHGIQQLNQYDIESNQYTVDLSLQF
ncbi:putative porin [Microbulbifer sp. TYP-18]|uniref:putative porin n=1 Tax=Microbulbifer sp. TYP-18 TaxID=3230024 RepID=UPI0034C6452F